MFFFITGCDTKVWWRERKYCMGVTFHHHHFVKSSCGSEQVHVPAIHACQETVWHEQTQGSSFVAQWRDTSLLRFALSYPRLENSFMVSIQDIELFAWICAGRTRLEHWASDCTIWKLHTSCATILWREAESTGDVVCRVAEDNDAAQGAWFGFVRKQCSLHGVWWRTLR